MVQTAIVNNREMDMFDSRHQVRTSRQQEANNSVGLQNLTQRQRYQRSTFFRNFDTKEKLIKTFAPSMWSYFMQRQEQCFEAPEMMIGDVDAYYGYGVALELLRNQMVGVYTISTAKTIYDTNAMNLAADLFIGKYGKHCSMYALMLYFGNYLTEYKSTYGQFDMQDILQQFGKKFLPWWRGKLNTEYETEQMEDESNTGLVGQEAKIWMLAQRLKEGQTVDDLRKCNLYKLGMLTDGEIEQAKQIAMESF